MWLRRLQLTFQRNRSKGLDATDHFTFTDDKECLATVVIRNQTVEVEEGHTGKTDLLVTADSSTWPGFLAKERKLVWALLPR